MSTSSTESPLPPVENLSLSFVRCTDKQKTSVADPHHFDADPDSFLFDADPTFHPNADREPQFVIFFTSMILFIPRMLITI